MQYIGDVYRPPSEASSFILQCTVGCAQNTCRFCSMYKKDSFFMRPQEDILADIAEVAMHWPALRRIFLADGDALVMPTPRLVEILETAHRHFPYLERATAYATVRDVLAKSDADLQQLRALGLTMIYLGLESGSDEILQRIDKRQTQADYVEAVLKAKRNGIDSSVTLIFGLGEQELSELHINESAKAISLSKPAYASFFSLHLSPGAPLYDDVKEGRFKLLSDEEILDEMKRFIEKVDSEGTIFRSNHASNPVPVGGTFNRDRAHMLQQIEEARRWQAYRPRAWRDI